ncbi:MAG TPA: hypothetical protein VGD81_05985 [Opitutaceae bacterium]
MTRFRRSRALRACLCLACFLAAARLGRSQSPEHAPPPAPAVFTSGRGQFEVIAPDAAAAAAVTTLAGEAWRFLAGPLGLPAGFSSSIFVRLVPAAEWRDAAVFRVAVEPGGIVSLRLRWEPALDAEIVRRALAQALLSRLAVAQHGVSANIKVPLWLEQGTVGWWITRAQPARLDGWQQEAADAVEVRLVRLLAWQRGEPEPRAWQLAALWWFCHLRDEAGQTSAWHDCLRRVLGGEDATAALVACYPALAREERARELWWLVGLHHQRRLKPLPLLNASESRAWLADLPRVVLSRDGADSVLSLDDLFAAREESVVTGEVAWRVARIGRELPWLHPLYRNAALSLGETFEAIQAGDATRFADAKAQFARDAAEGREIEAAMEVALDALDAAAAR